MKNILAFGDSNTYGYNPKDGSRFGSDARWTCLLGKYMEPLGFTVNEEGLCGRTTVFSDPVRSDRCGIDALPLILETHAPLHYIILMLGTNDCKSAFHASPEVITQGMAQLIGCIQRMTTARILLMSPILLADNVGSLDADFDAAAPGVCRQLQAHYAALAREKGCLFLAASDHARPSVYDGEHMDADGHRRLAQAVFSCLREDMLGRFIAER